MNRILKIYYPAFLVFITVLLFTIFSFYQIKKSTKARRSKLFEIQINQATESISKRIDDYIQVLKGCQAFFYASDTVTSLDWKIYTNNLNLEINYPGIQGIAYAKYIQKNERFELENRIRKNFPYFSIKSNLKNDYLTPIIYIEPKNSRNLRAFGFDMFSEENRRKAMEKALNSGKATISRKVTLVQETDKNVQPGFLLYLPVYKDHESVKTESDRAKNIKGFVYNPFRAYDLMNAVLGDFKDINIDVYDYDISHKSNLLYRSSPNNGASAPSEFSSYRTLYIAGSKWIISFSSGPNFGSSIERQQPALILVFGIAMSFMLFIITIGFINRRQAAIDELNLSKELERKKDEFIGIASHELKTPLTSVKAYLQMLERAELKDMEHSFVVKANSQINKLNNLISDLLDVSKIQAGRLELNIAPFKLQELIDESVISVLHMYRSHEIIKLNDIPEIVLVGDKFRLEQALINLLVNAIKYSPEAKKVYIETKASNEKVMIEIKDEGIGISKKNQERIFEKFYRPEELSPVFSGLGMGLYISSELVKRHQGKIFVDSELGKGSTFRIELPRNIKKQDTNR